MHLVAKIVALTLLPVAAAFAGAPHIAIMELQNIQCYGCLDTVKKALQKVPGVERIQMDLDNKTATVKFDPSRTNTEALVQATANAGFPSAVRK